jgi:D-tyrosyl-tRNA(Tyr) deacylase
LSAFAAATRGLKFNFRTEIRYVLFIDYGLLFFVKYYIPIGQLFCKFNNDKPKTINDKLYLAQMRAVIQRVTKASVTIESKIHSQIGNGLLVLLGIEDADATEDIEWLSGKIVNLRIFNDEKGVMNVSVKEIAGDIIVVSQFTLHASTKKGNRPSYIKASKPEFAIPVYEKFLKQLDNDLGKPVYTGIFGADMKLELLNDGPVTIVIDTKNKE